MKLIQIKDKKFRKFISAEEIDQAISKVAEQINHDYKDDAPVLLITLNGAIIFGADLLKKLTIDCTISCIKISSYAGIESTEQMKADSIEQMRAESREQRADRSREQRSESSESR